MNERTNKFLVAVEKFMPEMHLRQPGHTYSVCGLFTKNKKKSKKQKRHDIFIKMNYNRAQKLRNLYKFRKSCNHMWNINGKKKCQAALQLPPIIADFKT